MRILLINPNTTEAVTQRMAAAARQVASAGTEIRPVTARFGARIIGSRVETAISAAAVLEGLAREAAGCDAAIIGASVDSGLAAAREMLDIPVIGITEAALHAACLLGGRIGAIVVGANSDTILREMADAYGLGGRLGVVRRLALTPADLLADPAGATRAVAEAAAAMVAKDGVAKDGVTAGGLAAGGLAEDGAAEGSAAEGSAAEDGAAEDGQAAAAMVAAGGVAAGGVAAGGVTAGGVAAGGVDAVVLIGAVMAGLPGQVQAGVSVPVLEGVSAAVVLAEALVRLAVPPARGGSYARPGAEKMAEVRGFLEGLGG